jgi:hypothetical protein
VHLLHYFSFWYHAPRKIWQPWQKERKGMSERDRKMKEKQKNDPNLVTLKLRSQASAKEFLDI